MGHRSFPGPVTEWLLGLLLRAARSEEMIGDLIEEGKTRVLLRRGRFMTRLWLFFEAARSLRHLVSLKEIWTGVTGGSPLAQDIRFTFRQMARRPGSTVAVLLILAVGIGTTTAIFSLVHGVLLKPLPYPQSDRLVVLRETNLARGWTSFSLSPDNFLDWRERIRAFDLMAAYQRTSLTWTGTDRPEILTGFRITEDYQEALGLSLSYGRGIVGEDMAPGAPSVAVLDHGFWQRAFGGDPSVVGESLELDGEPVTIVGVLREGWRPLDQTRGHLLLPLPLSRHPTRRAGHWLSAVARLRPEATLAQAQGEMASAAAAQCV